MSVPGSLLPWINAQFCDANGAPLALGSVAFKVAGEDTDKDTFTSADLDVANTNPVLLDAAGRAVIFLESGAYDVTVSDADDVVVWQLLGVEDVGRTYFAQLGQIAGQGQKNLNATYTATNSDNFITFDSSSVRVLNLQQASEREWPLTVKNLGSAAVTVTPFTLETIDGATGNYSLLAGATFTLVPVTSGYLIQSGIGLA